MVKYSGQNPTKNTLSIPQKSEESQTMGKIEKGGETEAKIGRSPHQCTSNHNTSNNKED